MVLVRIIIGGVLGIILTLTALVGLAFAEPIEQTAHAITDRGGLVDGGTIRVTATPRR